VILKEALTPGLLAGGILILASVLITTRARRPRRTEPVRADPSPLTAAENA
jgi:drug/metabolite transporter (DMT)-like permease